MTAITILTLALGACAGSQSRSATYGTSPVETHSFTIRFDNQAQDHVHVYLIGQRHEWLLGRVEPGAIATLRMPEEVFDGDPGYVQLAVLTGGGVTQRAARDPRAQLTILQDPSAILAQRWRMSQGQLTSTTLRGATASSR